VAVEAPTCGFVEACPGRMPWRCGVLVGDGWLVSRDALFMPPRVVPNNRLLVDLGRDVGGRRVGVTTDATGLTSVPDAWAPAMVDDQHLVPGAAEPLSGVQHTRKAPLQRRWVATYSAIPPPLENPATTNPSGRC
jgi:hypothetical protein